MGEISVSWRVSLKKFQQIGKNDRTNYMRGLLLEIIIVNYVVQVLVKIQTALIQTNSLSKPAELPLPGINLNSQNVSSKATNFFD